MKKLIPLLFLLLFLGCDRGPIIEDFKIEGVGLGDSLLDVFSKNEIEEKTLNPTVDYSIYNPPNLFYEYYKSKNLVTYKRMSFFVHSDDNNMKIQGIFGELGNSSLDKCYAEQDSITQEFMNMFPEAEYYDYDIYESPYDEGISWRENVFAMPDNEELRTQCYDIQNDAYAGNRDLYISLTAPELSDWLQQ